MRSERPRIFRRWSVGQLCNAGRRRRCGDTPAKGAGAFDEFSQALDHAFAFVAVLAISDHFKVKHDRLCHVLHESKLSSREWLSGLVVDYPIDTDCVTARANYGYAGKEYEMRFMDNIRHHLEILVFSHIGANKPVSREHAAIAVGDGICAGEDLTRDSSLGGDDGTSQPDFVVCGFDGMPC